MKKRLTKLASLGFVATMCVGLLAGCGGSGDGGSSSGKTEIAFGIWDENQRPAMEDLVAAYEEENPDVKVNIELTPYSGGEYWTKLEAAAGGGTAPDVFWINVLHLDSYVEGGILADMTDAIAESDINDAYSETLVQNYVRDDVNYAVPKDFDTNALWYNKEMFDAAGVAYPTDDMTYDDPKTQEGIQCWIDLIDEGYAPSAATVAETGSDAMFQGEQVAMTFAGSYMVPEYANNDAVAEKIDCVEIPTYNDIEDNCINGLGYAVYEGSKNKDAAIDFAIWLGSKDAQDIQGESGVVISARTESQHLFAEAKPEYNLAAYTNHADIAYPLPMGGAKTAEIYDLESTWLTKAYTGEMSLADACAGLKEEADALLAE